MPATGRIALSVGKTDAMVALAERAGIGRVDPYAADLDPVFAAVAAALGSSPESALIFAESAGAAGVSEATVFAAGRRALPPPVFRNGRPDSFPLHFGHEDSPAFRVLSVAGGVFAHMARAPLVTLGDRRTVLRDVSSRYAPLLGYYDIDMEGVLDGARSIAGTALVLSDDIFPINFCHWLVDTLPRLAFLGDGADVTLIVSEEQAAFKRDSLALCGFAPDRVVYLPDFAAIRAERLLVPFDTRAMPHPAHKGAPWVMDFLRGRIGVPALSAFRRKGPDKIYVSRADAGGRRVLNEDAVMRLLAPLGYEKVTLSERGLAEQVALFAGAERIIGLHGAGLSGIVFAPARAHLLEILPASYGMPSFYVLSASRGLGYATYIAHDVRPGSRTQLDDVVIDVGDFRRRCGALL